MSVNHANNSIILPPLIFNFPGVTNMQGLFGSYYAIMPVVCIISQILLRVKERYKRGGSLLSCVFFVKKRALFFREWCVL